ncbi:PIG-P-domain-containing protein [Lentithecium fluviatile CBS 122367]|uniref:PIG-P-domain-containing protein n=1 Tax=Lentithecium fluviatile CBS 122367 TaxID=1168545 RepID=A0A6G1IRT1_9PLEO|nr:PIG-P-domain-containing protein [Lentithecium fluviatile CBS 122367]
MPPKARAKAVLVGRQGLQGFQSRSTPELPTLRSLDDQLSASSIASPSERDERFSDGSDSEDKGQESRLLHTSPSHTHLAPHTSAFFPPFYNRPPIPLPPSPSLTSLLRPAFSTTTSRRTTPDSSDVDIPTASGTVTNGTSTPGTSTSANLASITKSARHAPTVPRAAPKVPTYEYYGFAVYLASSAAFLLYIVWAYVPSPLLHQMGIHYYPNRWWALAVPCWLVGLVVYIYVALASYNTRYLTLPLSSLENLVDETAQVAVVDRRTRAIAHGSRSDSVEAHQFGPDEDVDWKGCWSISTDAVMDVPIGGVCEILYGGEDE